MTKRKLRMVRVRARCECGETYWVELHPLIAKLGRGVLGKLNCRAPGCERDIPIVQREIRAAA